MFINCSLYVGVNHQENVKVPEGLLDRLVPQDTMVAVPVIQGHVDRLVLAICLHVLTRKKKKESSPFAAESCLQ